MLPCGAARNFRELMSKTLCDTPCPIGPGLEARVYDDFANDMFIFRQAVVNITAVISALINDTIYLHRLAERLMSKCSPMA